MGNGTATDARHATSGAISGTACIFRVDGDESDRGFTLKDLDTIVANFEARKRGTQSEIPAPWHLGHEEDRALESVLFAGRTDGPQLADTTKVWREENRLMARVSAPPGVVEVVEKHYPYRSAEIARDMGDGKGPTLVGVGFLGAKQAGKRGMGPVVYNAANGKEVTCGRTITEAVRFDEEGAMGDTNKPAEGQKPAETPAVSVEKFAAVERELAETRALVTAQKALLEADKAERAAALAEVETAKRERLSLKAEAFCERELVLPGRCSAEVAAKVLPVLKRALGVEKFADGKTPFDDLTGLLTEVLPKTARTRPVSADISTDRPTVDRAKLAVEQFAAMHKAGASSRWETFADAAALTGDEKAAAEKLLPAALRNGKH